MSYNDRVAIDDWHHARPVLANSYLATFALGLVSARGLFARRRMGKSEFLLKDLVPAAARNGLLTAYVNLWESRADPAAAIVDAIASATAPEGWSKVAARLRTPVTKIKASARMTGPAEGALEAELADAPVATVAPVLAATLRRIDNAGTTLLLMLDEAQVLAAPEHGDLAHALRAALDVRKPTVKVIFAGSSESTLRRMFGRPSEPFYNWAPLEPFELLGSEFVRAMVQKVNDISKFPLTDEDALAAFDALHRTPEFFRRYLNQYVLHPAAGSAAALADTVSHVFGDANFLPIWSSLLPADRALLQLMAEGAEDLHGKAVRTAIGEALGVGKMVPLNVPQQSLARLRAGGLVVRVDQGEYRFEDEAFADWVRRLVLEAP